MSFVDKWRGLFKDEVEVLAMDFIGWATDPNVTPKPNGFTQQDLMKGRLVFNKKNGCWCFERPTIGKIIGTTFYPRADQSVKYNITVNEYFKTKNNLR